MSDRTAFAIAGLVALAILADLLLNAGSVSLFLVRKLFDLVEYLAFWR